LPIADGFLGRLSARAAGFGLEVLRCATFLEAGLFTCGFWALS
jgi:hypothetical protein